MIELTGRYQDRLFSSRTEQWQSGWRSNRIVADCSVLLAALMKRQEGIEGLLFWAVGAGEEHWDNEMPSTRPGTTRLTREVARQRLGPDQVTYLDAAGNSTGDPTSRLEITASFTGADVAQPLREFGLFGGDASSAPGSGFMVDQVIHPRIDLASDDTLRRQLRLSFEGGTLRSEVTSGFGADLPVISIEGVGAVYGEMLAARGIRTLGDLADIDPLRPLEGLSTVNLREFQAKARMVLSVPVVSESFRPFAGRTVSEVLTAHPDRLAGEIGSPEVTSDVAAALQDDLAVLQVALDEERLQEMMIGDVMEV